MSEKFPRAKARGYNVAEVEEFLAHARVQFLDPTSRELDVLTLRATRFNLEKHGYSISAVDAAIEKLEDVFASRELAFRLSEIGRESFTAETQEIRELIGSRVSRLKSKRFAKRRFPNRGYNRRAVDVLCSQIATYLSTGENLTIRDVRLSVFKPQRGGYAEHQVDAFLDKTIELLQRDEILNQTNS